MKDSVLLELKAATIEITHLDRCLFQENVGKPFISVFKDNISSQFRFSKDVSAFSIFNTKKVRNLSLATGYLYMETVQFNFSLDSLGEIYQQTYWKELNLRWKCLSLLTSAQSGKSITSSLLSSKKMIYNSPMTCL